VTNAQDEAPTGPANPRASTGPDAPTPPGGPQRADAPEGSATPGEDAEGSQAAPEPEVHPSSSPGPGDGSTNVPVEPSRSEPTADGEIHARTQTEQVNEELQEENAESSLDQPSDGSGGE